MDLFGPNKCGPKTTSRSVAAFPPLRSSGHTAATNASPPAAESSRTRVGDYKRGLEFPTAGNAFLPRSASASNSTPVPVRDSVSAATGLLLHPIPAGPMGTVALPPPPTTFHMLPDDGIHLILRRIPCKADRGRMFLVCRAWRTVLTRVLKPDHPPREVLLDLLRSADIPPDIADFVLKNDWYARKAYTNLLAPSPLPWLLLPAQFSDGSYSRAACVLSSCRVHHYLKMAPPGARFFGSENGWLFVHRRAPHNETMLLRPRHHPRTVHCYFDRVDGLGLGLLYPHYMTLSARPDDADCFAAAVVTWWWSGAASRRRGVAVWNMSGSDGRGPRLILGEDPGVDDSKISDVVRFMGRFHFLTRGDSVRVCIPIVKDRRLDLDGGWEVRRFVPARVGDDLHIRARYLVVSRGELLMVVRFAPHPLQRETSAFKVFVEAERKKPDMYLDFPVPEYPWSWSELDTLGGRMLFVAHGCSRSYDADQYPGFQGGIYFLDDGNDYDDGVIFGCGMRRYPCSDNGNWSDGQVLRCFPWTAPSDHSTPVWLLP